MPRHQSVEISAHGRSAGCRVSDASKSGEKNLGRVPLIQAFSFSTAHLRDGEWQMETMRRRRGWRGITTMVKYCSAAPFLSLVKKREKSLSYSEQAV